MIDYETQLLTYQGNVIPSLLDSFAKQLHVSTASLTALGVGFALRVPTKNGHNIFNSWVFPERDANGEIVGLLLRQPSGQKFVVPGSKRGLSFIPNVSRSRVQPEKYNAGPQNWVRATEDTPCPVCRKLNWCLLSSEDPDDPKAVICSRVKVNATKDLGESGWLHLRKPEAIIRGAVTLLPSSDFPVLVVEGVSDVAAAYDLGLVAVGTPNSGGRLDYVSSLVAGRSLIIIGENDAGAGQAGMDKAHEILLPVSKQAIKVMPPEGHKDLRQWVEHGLTREELLGIASQGGDERTDNILSKTEPVDLARFLVAERFTQQNMCTLVRWHGDWLEYVGNRYHALNTMEFRGLIYTFFHGKQYKKFTKDGFNVLNFEIDKYGVDKIVDALSCVCGKILADNTPVWRGDELREVDPRYILTFDNGRLNVEEYLRGQIVLHEPGPELFTLSAYPFSFNRMATCPLWMRFLAQVFPHDRKKSMLLQEWFGYNLTPDNTQEKFMMMLGPTRAGKSTIIDVMVALLGESQVVSTSFEAYTRRFGLFPFIGKTSAVIGDVTIDARHNAVQALNVLKKITGNDPVEIERKGKDIEQSLVRLFTRFTMASNVMPRFPDASRVIESRMLLLKFTESFAGREDTSLKARLREEIPGVLLWALGGLQRIKRTKIFTQPDDHAAEMQDIRRELTPVACFVEDCCVVSPKRTITATKKQLYNCWKSWAIEHGEQLYSERWLGRMIVGLYPSCRIARKQDIGDRRQVITGIMLKPEYQKLYSDSIR